MDQRLFLSIYVRDLKWICTSLENKA
jgi:hypothetical protein